MQIIGFDMGGTSTDVSRYAGSYEQVLETQTAGVIIQVNFSGLCYCPLKYVVLTGWVLGLVEYRLKICNVPAFLQY
jgi:hypothetical protein